MHPKTSCVSGEFLLSLHNMLPILGFLLSPLLVLLSLPVICILLICKRRSTVPFKFLDFSISTDCGVYFHKAPINSKKPGIMLSLLMFGIYPHRHHENSWRPSFLFLDIHKEGFCAPDHGCLLYQIPVPCPKAFLQDLQLVLSSAFAADSD